LKPEAIARELSRRWSAYAGGVGSPALNQGAM